MKTILSILLAPVLALGLGLSYAPAEAAPLESLTCTGKVVGKYTDDGAKPKTFDYKSVDVPEGESCTLLNVSVKGNVKSLHGSKNVRVLDSYVGGNVHVKDATGLVHVGQKGCKFDPAVRVNVLVYDSHHVLVCYVDAHNIQVKRNDGRITLRDNVAHRIDVSQNLKCVKCKNGHRRPGVIRILRNDAEQHIHAFHNRRQIIARGNTPEPVIR